MSQSWMRASCRPLRTSLMRVTLRALTQGRSKQSTRCGAHGELVQWLYPPTTACRALASTGGCVLCAQTEQWSRSARERCVRSRGGSTKRLCVRAPAAFDPPLPLPQVHYDGRAINLGFFYSTVDAARGYDLCARVVAALGFPRRLNFPIDSALDAAAAAALAALPIPADELRSSLAPASGTPLKERLAIIRRVIRSIYVPGRHLRSPKASSFRGVSRNEKRWSARLQVGGRMKRLGTFKTEEEAARAYDTAAVAAGLTQRLNFPPTKQGA